MVRLIVELLAPTEGMRICDPTAGSAGMLIYAAQYVAEQGGNPRNLVLHGQERNLGTLAIGKLNLLLHGLRSAQYEGGDVIAEPRLRDAQGLLNSYDRVIANPPFSLKEWGHDFAPTDPHRRFDRYGAIPPKTKGDLAFLQHMLAVTTPGGMVGVVMPHGILFRGGAEGTIRRGIVEADLFEAVIGLAPNLFYGASIPVAICVLNKDKRPERQGKVLFVDAAQPGYFRARQGAEPPRPRARDDDRGGVRRLRGGRALRARGRLGGDPRQRLQPQHLALRRHDGARGGPQRRGGAGAAARGGAPARRVGGAHGRPAVGAGVCRWLGTRSTLMERDGWRVVRLGEVADAR